VVGFNRTARNAGVRLASAATTPLVVGSSGLMAPDEPFENVAGSNGRRDAERDADERQNGAASEDRTQDERADLARTLTGRGCANLATIHGTQSARISQFSRDADLADSAVL
jgi:hypothetical protein